MVGATTRLNPGWLRFPSGTGSDAYDWRVGLPDSLWSLEFESPPGAHPDPGRLVNRFLDYRKLGRAKGFVKLHDFVRLAAATGSDIVICINGFTSDPDHSRALAQYVANRGIEVAYWEMANEPYNFTNSDDVEFWPTGLAYADDLHDHAIAIRDVLPDARIAVSLSRRKAEFNDSVRNYSQPFWNAISYHSYHGIGETFTESRLELNGSLEAIGAGWFRTFFQDYLQNPETDVIVTEYGVRSNSVEGTLYHAVYVAEFVVRMVADGRVTRVGLQRLAKAGLAPTRAGGVDWTDTLRSARRGVRDTRNWDFNLRTPVPGLAMQLVNTAVNFSRRGWITNVVSSPMVETDDPAVTIPALHAAAFEGNNGANYLLITNKSHASQVVGLYSRSLLSPLGGPLYTSFITHRRPNVRNTPARPSAVRVQTEQWPGSELTIHPSSVTLVRWDRAIPRSAPSAPTDLTVVADIDGATLSWTPPPGATGFYVKHGTRRGLYHRVQELQAPFLAHQRREHTVTGLAGDVPAHFVVSAYSASGESANSAAVRVTPIRPTLFQDDFESPYLRAPGVRRPWREVGQGWTVEELGTNREYVARPGAGEALSVVDDTHWSDYEVTVDFSLVQRGLVVPPLGLEAGERVGVIARHLDADNYYAAYLDGSGEVHIVQRRAGKEHPLAQSAPLEIEGATPSRSIRLEADVHTLRAYLDGELVAAAELPDQAGLHWPSGHAGVYVRGVEARFDEFVIR